MINKVIKMKINFFDEIFGVLVNGTCIDITDKNLDSDKIDNFDTTNTSVSYRQINVNRWIINKNRLWIEDITTGNGFSYSSHNISEVTEQLNRVDIERARAEAKIRAINL